MMATTALQLANLEAELSQQEQEHLAQMEASVRSAISRIRTENEIVTTMLAVGMTVAEVERILNRSLQLDWEVVNERIVGGVRTIVLGEAGNYELWFSENHTLRAIKDFLTGELEVPPVW